MIGWRGRGQGRSLQREFSSRPGRWMTWRLQELRMDRLYAFLEDVRQGGYARGNFLGFLNVLIGRRIERPKGTVVSSGVTWRALAQALKKLRWDPNLVRELGIDPRTLAPRDRVRYWYGAIAQAAVDSAKANQAGDRMAKLLESQGYTISPSPGLAAS